MRHYYIPNKNTESGFEEIGETEWRAVIGDDITAPFAGEVYRGEITLEEVPEEYRETVAAIVAARVERWGDNGGEATETDLYNALAELGVTDDEESDA